MTRRYSSGLVSTTGERMLTMALLTQTSIGPRRSSVSAASRAATSGSATSPRTIRAVAPNSSASRLAASRPSVERAIRPTRYPAAAKARAEALPMPLDAPVMTATFFMTNHALLSDSGLAGLADLRLRRNRGADGDHGGRAVGAADPDGPADDAGHARHLRSGSGATARDPHPLRQRSGLRPLLRVRLRPDRTGRMAPRRSLRAGPRPPGVDPDHSGPAVDPSSNGVRTHRARAHRPGATGAVRPELRPPDGGRHAVGAPGLRRDPGRVPEALAASIESAAATRAAWLSAWGWFPSISPLDGSISSASR